MPRLRSHRTAPLQPSTALSAGPDRVRTASREVLSGAHAGEFDHYELLSKVCQYFCEGGTPSVIQQRLAQADGLRISRRWSLRHLTFRCSIRFR